ncbi:XrtN system VIT domain protein [Filimonas zeae]|uniref:VIT domain-containing protein n=1 Tax=Filimonas zeae TaxID=1737353 RepID=A0A917MX47_9BACT|nr:XrtN system VIT domain-containing protein [Filimonas zeae]MDR6338898.1 XrtN system VIT domain protein [Filimonas zeae]GGH66066.1 hypothetical protein GCM10011379_19850 [Filimonas zeae]
MLTLKEKWNDTVWSTGMLLLLVQILLFVAPLLFQIQTEALFMIHIGLAGCYFLVLLFSGRLKKGREGLHVFWIFLVLFLISAYGLNRQMEVFQSATLWMCWVLVISCINYLSFYFFTNMPGRLQQLQTFILGASLPFYAYLALYLVPLYGISLLAAIGIGISLHTFVPLLFFIYSVVLIKRYQLTGSRYRYALMAGIAFSVIITICFVFLWCVNLSHINRKYGDASIEGNPALPAWVNTARTLPQNMVTEKMLKTGLVYETADAGHMSFFSLPSRSIDEQRKHDPLVITSSLLAGTINMADEKRIKVLEAMYQARHQAQERLWLGDHLFTDKVDTKVAIWPSFRMSYTELGVVISNQAPPSPWSDGAEEAIYSFQLPQGSVVTSLSLWINGREEKGLLTTKAQADTAYKTIVGVQRRDPSVVHWQEGNIITVRVFPVLRNQHRKFKIGVTSPLQLRNNQLYYTSVFFKGPDWSGAKATTEVQVMGPQTAVHLPLSFVRAGEQTYLQSGSYKTDWEMSVSNTEPSGEAFVFNGKAWHPEPYTPVTDTTSFTHVYLDINEAWTSEECNTAYQMVKYKKVYVANEKDELTQVTEENKSRLFKELRQYRFSLFPFFRIKEPFSALVVSKGTFTSPVLHDLKGHGFLQQLQQCFANGQRIKLFNIGDTLSPYIRTLKEFRAFHYAAGNLIQLSGLLRSRQFVAGTENDNRIELPEAGMAIIQSDSALARSNGTAPDHLMRLFAYNHILQKSGTALLAGEEVPEPVITEAQQAYVVSPASSLIVLETQQDYDRFDIKASKNSLQNAAHQATGSVPEPHEWVLIIIVLLVLIFAVYRPSLL